MKDDGQPLEWSKPTTEPATQASNQPATQPPSLNGTPWVLAHLAEAGMNLELKVNTSSNVKIFDLGTKHNEAFAGRVTNMAEVAQISERLKQRVIGPLRELGFILVDDVKDRAKFNGLPTMYETPPDEKP